ncbi:hypothetical protein HBI56_222680 [Parastagonospora nodorum]|uniref:N-acetyltransferase domain-containing protein n=1 Tax=Phaeosphaeria nodorum (strain SN15 / ATCC MYA-4574 / FGSC 10173) TaxID=321614 RepID=A0A7U2F074_PHANO|nr:hypothetical protein HBH56_148290 [Parastagonospora nodorum]QRC94099.1 hypothetical protein JI435_073760 [Parastagonospora nodorum SN15]KAH3923218.1 hypothetical protein HBH54_212930 [Parastagonospora nodorum]KAH3945987.1 hypothetical protein HBH53_135750 [Parastagonospora nodorum]KAH3984066.1 hypothetical protein HBH52_064270 [Parastagonospora nodorum]
MLLPQVHSVRIATLDDLPRIAFVAASAFFWSPTFRYQRPHYGEYPKDTLASYWNEYEESIRDPAYVVLVAEDFIETDEADHVYEALKSACRPSTPGRKVIVGLCSVLLKPGSSYTGHFQSTNSPESIHQFKHMDLKRDQCADATKIYRSVMGPPKSRHLAGRMRLSTIAVAPGYWRRGHATRLVSFCTQLADLDDALLGVSATPLGALLVAKAGFEECEIVRIDQSLVHRGPSEKSPNAVAVELWLGLRWPFGMSSGNASQSASPE